MLELVIVSTLFWKMLRLADDRGHSKVWGLAAPGSWFGGEVVGFAVGDFIGLPFFVAYALGIVCAAAAIALAWHHVKSLPDR